MPTVKKANNDITNTSKILFYGVVLFFIFEYTRPGFYLPILSILKLNTLIPISVFFFSIFDKTIENVEILKSKNSKWFIYFLLLLFISVLTADVTLYAFNAWKTAFSYLLIYFSIRKHVIDISRLKIIFTTLLLSHMFIVVMNPDVVLHPEERSYLTGVTFLGDGNDYSLSVCIIVPFALFLYQEADSKLMKCFYFTIFAILVFSIIGTQSRGGSLGLIALMLYQWIKSKKKLVGVMTLILLAAIVLIYAPEQYFDRMSTITNYQNEGSAMGRIHAWKSAIRMAIDHPFLGVGAGHFGVKFGVEYRPVGYGRSDMPWLTAHSMYFLILGELGFSGIIFLVGIIISNFLQVEKKIREIKKSKSFNSNLKIYRLFIALNSSLIGFAVSGAFLSVLFYPHLYIIAGLFGSGEFIYSKCQQNNSEE